MAACAAILFCTIVETLAYFCKKQLKSFAI